MAQDPEENTALRRHLEDVDCPRDTVESFLPLYRQKRWDEAIRLLAGHRGRLLEAMHRSQQKLDNLDLLIYKLKRERENEK